CAPPLFSSVAPTPPAIYTLSLHDALPIFKASPTPPIAKERLLARPWGAGVAREMLERAGSDIAAFQPDGLDPAVGLQGDVYRLRSEEHTSELQSRENLVCRLLLEKKKNRK